MLIVEGPDGAGKSSLVARLSKDLDMYVMPRVVSQDGGRMADLVRWVHDDVTSGLKRAIYDRHRLISELIYGPLLRDSLEPGFDNHNWLRYYMQRLQERDPFVVFCLPPIENVRKNVADDETSGWMSSKAEEIYWLYHGMAAVWPTRTMVWDYTMDDSHHKVRGHTRYNWMLSDITGWLFEKGLNEHK